MEEENRPIRVVLIDDHHQVHLVVAALLANAADISLVGQGANGQEALSLCRELQPDVMLMDVVMPVIDGVAATRQILAEFPGQKILVLSSYHDHENVYAMLRNGAAGYITKGDLPHELVHAIRTTHRGNVVLAPEVATKLLQQEPVVRAARFQLTDRELEVLVSMAGGQTMNEIAAELAISASTVRFHIGNIQEKLGVETRTEALIVAAKNNLV